AAVRPRHHDAGMGRPAGTAERIGDVPQAGALEDHEVARLGLIPTQLATWARAGKGGRHNQRKKWHHAFSVWMRGCRTSVSFEIPPFTPSDPYRTRNRKSSASPAISNDAALIAWHDRHRHPFVAGGSRSGSSSIARRVASCAMNRRQWVASIE